jgi:hypothetical protein
LGVIPDLPGPKSIRKSVGFRKKKLQLYHDAKAAILEPFEKPTYVEHSAFCASL